MDPIPFTESKSTTEDDESDRLLLELIQDDDWLVSTGSGD